MLAFLVDANLGTQTPSVSIVKSKHSKYIKAEIISLDQVNYKLECLFVYKMPGFEDGICYFNNRMM